jgi:predicted  nucleic acid-binding Zn-ribbon protein
MSEELKPCPFCGERLVWRGEDREAVALAEEAVAERDTALRELVAEGARRGKADGEVDRLREALEHIKREALTMASDGTLGHDFYAIRVAAALTPAAEEEA